MKTQRIVLAALASLGLVSGAATAGHLATDPALVEKGKQLYDQNCMACHQEDAVGKPGLAPSLTNPELLSVASMDFMVGTIRDGRPGTGMPPFSHLGYEGIKAIVAFLNEHDEQASRAATIDAQPPSQGDPRLGKVWYEQVCSGCHGTNGEGYESGVAGPAIGKTGFLDKATDGFIRTTIREGRSNTRMLGFSSADPRMMAELTDQEIEDIIAFLRTVPSK